MSVMFSKVSSSSCFERLLWGWWSPKGRCDPRAWVRSWACLPGWRERVPSCQQPEQLTKPSLVVTEGRQYSCVWTIVAHLHLPLYPLDLTSYLPGVSMFSVHISFCKEWLKWINEWESYSFLPKHTQTFLTETDSKCMCHNMHKNSDNTDIRCPTGNPEETGMLLYYDGRTLMIRWLHQSRSINGSHQSQLHSILN